MLPIPHAPRRARLRRLRGDARDRAAVRLADRDRVRRRRRCSRSALAFALTMPLGARLRRQRLEFAWWLVDRGRARRAGAVAGAPFEMRCQLQNRGQQPVRLRRAAAGRARRRAGRSAARGSALALPPRARSEFAFTLVSSAAGARRAAGARGHGAGAARAVPRAAVLSEPARRSRCCRAARRSARRRARPASGEALERSGLSPLRRRGVGHGAARDPRAPAGRPVQVDRVEGERAARACCWCARSSARCRTRCCIVLDISGSMRGGAPGQRKLDHCDRAARRCSRSRRSSAAIASG